MKKTTKILSTVLALVLVLALSLTAFADSTGSITITNAVKDHTYTVYQMLSFTPTAEGADTGLYTIVSGWENFVKAQTDYFVVDAATGYVSAGTKTVDADLAAAAIAYAKDANNNVSAAATPVTATTTEVEFTDLSLGYYAVDTTVGTICSLVNTDSNLKLVEKNDVPSLEKKIVEGTQLVDSNDVNINDTVTYQTTITVGAGTSDYVMHDKMSAGLTYTAVTSVKVGDTDVAAANYTVTTTDLTDGCTFEVAFDDNYIASLDNDTEIVVTYTATLNENAVIGTTGNPNEAWLEYSTDDGVTSTETTHDTVITYTTKLTVNKVDSENKALAGAGFTLYVKNTEGAYVAVGSEITGVTTFTWTGLAAGEYKIVETTVPQGYNKADDVEFTISVDLPVDVTASTDAATWKVNEGSTVSVANGVYSTNIENNTGSLLPETGGIGTTIFYIVGGLLVVAAGIYLITKKKMSAQA